MAGKASVLGSVSFGWLYDQGGFRCDEPFFMDPGRRLAQEQAINAFVAERFAAEPIYNFEAGLVQVEGRRRPVALVPRKVLLRGHVHLLLAAKDANIARL